LQVAPRREWKNYVSREGAKSAKFEKESSLRAWRPFDFAAQGMLGAISFLSICC
jgi:hypothetical protein